MELIFRVNGQQIERVDNEILAENSQNYLRGWVVFEDGWEDIESKKLMFILNNNTISVDLDDQNSFDETADLQLQRGVYSVVAYGTNSAGTVIRTIPLRLPVRASGGII